MGRAMQLCRQQPALNAAPSPDHWPGPLCRHQPHQLPREPGAGDSNPAASSRVINCSSFVVLPGPSPSHVITSHQWPSQPEQAQHWHQPSTAQWQTPLPSMGWVIRTIFWCKKYLWHPQFSSYYTSKWRRISPEIEIWWHCTGGGSRVGARLLRTGVNMHI